MVNCNLNFDPQKKWGFMIAMFTQASKKALRLQRHINGRL